MSKAIDDIAAERQRQIDQEGWTPEHDDHHDASEMALVAASYCYSAAQVDEEAWTHDKQRHLPEWPWEQHWWKPKSPREDLVRAGALIAAEIDRLDRAANRT